MSPQAAVRSAAPMRHPERHGRIDDPLRRPGRAPEPGAGDIVDEWGLQSFPASDPPANW